MAGENKLEQGSGAQPPQGDAGTPGAGQQQDAGAAGAAGAAAAQGAGQGAAGSGAIDYKTEYEKLQASQKELQSQFTTVSQEAARTRELVEAIKPYVDYSRMGAQGGEGAGVGANEAGSEAGAEGDETYLNAKQVKELLNSTVQQVRGEIIAQQVRSQYPDVCDNDWKEVIVRNELGKIAKTHPYEDAPQRIKRAVEAARTIIKGVQDEGRKQAEADHQKAEEEAKKKAAAAAAASGLEATGVTSPPGQGNQTGSQEMSNDSYVSGRRDRRAKTQTVAP